jgi:glycine cleavage system regulatory protein
VLEENMPYIIEVVGLESSDILNKVMTFLNERSIDVEEVNARRYPAPYLDAQLCSARFVIAIPQNLSLFLFRDELMYVCDQINADVIFEPFRN